MKLPKSFRNDCRRFALYPAFKAARTLVPVLLALAASSLQAAIPASERQVLLDLYNATDGPNWLDNTGWNGAPGTECNWYGVSCDFAETRVEGILLEANGLSGPLPSLADLTDLIVIDVSRNAVDGPIPAVPQGLNQFVAADTLLSGQIPDLLTTMPGVARFIVPRARLTGPMPDLDGLTSLRTFNVERNALVGQLPSMTNVPGLERFSVDHNQLEGPIPDLGDVPGLKSFFVDENQLTGSIPELDSLPNLEFFGVGANRLTGEIPDLAGLPLLLYFNVHDNGLTGSIPSLSGLSSLSTFDVSNNRLTGELPDFTDTSNLFFFSAENNGIEGEIPSLAGLTQLNAIRLAGNFLVGTVPPIDDVPLSDGASSLCGNQLVSSGDEVLDQAWEAATGTDWIECQAIFRPIPVASPWMLAVLILVLLGAAVPMVVRRG